MAKFSSDRFPPGFFDLPQRAGETLPGEFYEPGQAVYGPDAELVEMVGEEHTTSGETVITEAMRLRLARDHQLTLQARVDVAAELGIIHRVVAAPTLDGLDLSDAGYPAPFSSGFSESLSRYSRTRRCASRTSDAAVHGVRDRPDCLRRLRCVTAAPTR